MFITQRIDVGGYSLAYSVQGTGSPTVVLIAGGAHTAQAAWSKIAPTCAEFARVVTYDRPFLGESDSAPLPRTWQHMSDELYELLRCAEIAGPYVLVGQSLGGTIARFFAQDHFSEVAGIVFVDAMQHGQAARYLPILPPETPSDSEMLRNVRRWYTTQTGGEPTVHIEDPECVDWRISLNQARKLGSLGDLPIHVLAAEQAFYLPDDRELAKALQAERFKIQKELAGLSTQSLFQVVPRSGHIIQIDHPQIVIEAIRSLANRPQSAS